MALVFAIVGGLLRYTEDKSIALSQAFIPSLIDAVITICHVG